MELAGKDSLHILDLMFDEPYMESTFEKRSYKDEKEMWEHRLKIKELFMSTEKNLKNK